MINLGFMSPSGEMYTCQPFEKRIILCYNANEKSYQIDD